MKKLLSALLLFTLWYTVSAQVGLEDVIVEVYYISDANDATDTDGGNLPEGSVTYRVFVDLAEGWELQSVYGNEFHELYFATSTFFFNNIDWGEQTGREIRNNRLNRHTTALDSWVTIGSASDGNWAVLKAEDTDGSIVGGANNNGGSAGIAGGLLVNENPLAGIPLTTADGLIPGPGPDVTLIASPEPWDVFGTVNSTSTFSTSNGAWAVLGGTVGPTPTNRILVAQVTTDGDLSFELNIAIGLETGGSPEKYVSGNVQDGEFFFAGLTYPFVPLPGCLDAAACNFDPDANTDDGSCLLPEINCTTCNANNDGLDIIDADGDGVCDAAEIAGCTDPEAVNFNADATDDDGSCVFESIPGCINPNACNFDPEATVNDGSCILPVMDCSICNENNDGLDIVDTDGDGVCDADEIAGCQSPTACNYNPNATDDNNQCLEPVENCEICNENNTALILVDTDGDEICDADEIAGCPSPTACNYNPQATDDDGTCLEPVVDCQECNEANDALVIIDTDGDGVCDAEEIFGCTDPLATNYNSEATEDDGSCIPLGLTENEGGMTLGIYPNPARAELKLELGQIASQGEEVLLTIYSPLAIAVQHFNFGFSSGSTMRETLDVGNLPSGIYFMEIRMAEYRIIRKFVRE